MTLASRVTALVNVIVLTLGVLICPAYAGLWGTPPPTSLYLGMWTFHLMPKSQEKDNADNYLIGIFYRGFFAVTFADSFNHRNYAVGIQRNWLQESISVNCNYYLGYRLGLVYGYGDHVIDLHGLTPVLPFAQLVGSVTWKNFGLGISYTGIVASVELYVKF